MRHKAFERRGMKAEAGDGFEAPAQPRGSEREGRRRRIRNPLTRIELLGQACAGAMPERIAGGEHRRRPAAATQHDLRIERHRPRAATAGHPCKRKMTLTAKDSFRVRERLSA